MLELVLELSIPSTEKAGAVVVAGPFPFADVALPRISVARPRGAVPPPGTAEAVEAVAAPPTRHTHRSAVSTSRSTARATTPKVGVERWSILRGTTPSLPTDVGVVESLMATNERRSPAPRSRLSQTSYQVAMDREAARRRLLDRPAWDGSSRFAQRRVSTAGPAVMTSKRPPSAVLLTPPSPALPLWNRSTTPAERAVSFPPNSFSPPKTAPPLRSSTPAPLPEEPLLGETLPKAELDDVLQLLRLDREPRDDSAVRTGVTEYAQACTRKSLVPSSRVLQELGHERCCLQHTMLGEEGGQALAAGLAANRKITTLELEEAHLGEVAAEQVVLSLLHNDVLTSLDLSLNHLTSGAVHALARGLDPHSEVSLALTRLELGRCGLSDGDMPTLAGALHFNKSLVKLLLPGNKIADHGAEALGVMLKQNRFLRELDLSWNCIKAPGARALAGFLRCNSHLRVLNLAWNGLETAGAVVVGEMLEANSGLTELDLSACRISAEAAMVISEGLKQNETLLTLTLNENPIGSDGGRHLMDALEVNEVLTSLGLQGVSFYSKGNGQAGFNPHNPDGKYKLLLSSPIQRSIATQLVTLARENAARSGDPLNTGWTHVKLNNLQLDFDLGRLKWPRLMPKEGELTLEYKTVRGLGRDEKVLDEEDLLNMIEQLANPRSSDFNRLDLLKMFTKHHLFSSAQGRRLLHAFSAGDERVRACVLLFTRLVDAEHLESEMLADLTAKELARLKDELGVLQWYTSGNPTGHYELNLVSVVGRLVATRLMELALLEGGSKNWRNVEHGSRRISVSFGAPAEWVAGGLPDSGVLRFDFTSLAVPPPDASVATDGNLFALLSMLSDRSQHSELIVARLRLESARYYLTCRQATRILEAFTWCEERIEVVVMLYSRIIDKKNFWQLLYKLRPLEQAFAVNRLGTTVVFDREHPSLHYNLDTTNPEHMELAKTLVKMALRDTKRQSFNNLVVNGRRIGGVPEGDSMWGLLTTESFTPTLDFDFLGDDIPVEKCSVTAKKLLFERARDIHQYYLEALHRRLSVKLPSGASQVTSKPGTPAERPKTESGSTRPKLESSSSTKLPPRTPPADLRSQALAKFNSASTRRGGVGNMFRPFEKAARMDADDRAAKLKKLRGAASRAPSPSGRSFHWQQGWDAYCRGLVQVETSKMLMPLPPLREHFFNALDVDGSNDLSLSEMQIGWQRVFGCKLNAAKAQALFELIDLDCEGGISWEEFEEIVVVSSTSTAVFFESAVSTARAQG